MKRPRDLGKADGQSLILYRYAKMRGGERSSVDIRVPSQDKQ